MEIISRQKNIFLLRFDRGDEVIASLKAFAGKNKISAGFFSGIGAADKITISYYDLKNKKYIDKDFQGLEIINLAGNIAILDKEIVIHGHGVFSDKKMRALAGHVKKLTVSATCEMALTAFRGKWERTYSKETGLNLLK